ALQPLQAQYDIALIDCQPALGMLSINALSAADQVIVPMQAEYLALNGLSQLMNTLNQIRAQINPDIELTGALITRYDRRLTLHRESRQAITDALPQTYATVIRPCIALAEATAQGLTIFEYAPNSNGAADYRSLTKEYLKREHDKEGRHTHGHK
ncbi:MAG: ParA family protein, partial [Atopobium sp.]|nr:ParA family protein [Atopobium sp.]